MRAGAARLIAGLVVLLSSILSGCVSLPQSEALRQPPPDLPRRAVLDSVPFHAQDAYQCGPAALAMILNAAGVAASPEALAEEVYLPARKGSLQVELLTGARRHGLLAYELAPELKDILAEIAAGNAVLVLQNLGLFSFRPYWHYAVVIGYDLGRRELLLHTGTSARRAMSLGLFEFLWRDGGDWAMVALKPGRVPASAREAPLAAASVALEKSGRTADAHSAYAALLARWPENFIGLMGLGNTAYALGDRIQAESAFRGATKVQPHSAAAFNNLAQTLSDLGRTQAALDAAREAVRLAGGTLPAASATLAEIQRKAR